MPLSAKGEATRAAIVGLLQEREARIGRDGRLRNGLRSMLVSSGPVVEYLSGLDDDGWATWVELQRLIAEAYKGAGGIDALEAAADDLDVLADRSTGAC